jgi:hypothetical protein
MQDIYNQRYGSKHYTCGSYGLMQQSKLWPFYKVVKNYVDIARYVW